mmetsp:Transcript_1614/g.3631  ORF Transcript_1614/g.3631 Transcript_1614/m.3631 type:complete len:227 (+) Transcript_1614:589-1269(+)
MPLAPSSLPGAGPPGPAPPPPPAGAATPAGPAAPPAPGLSRPLRRKASSPDMSSAVVREGGGGSAPLPEGPSSCCLSRSITSSISLRRACFSASASAAFLRLSRSRMTSSYSFGRIGSYSSCMGTEPEKILEAGTVVSPAATGAGPAVPLLLLAAAASVLPEMPLSVAGTTPLPAPLPAAGGPLPAPLPAARRTEGGGARDAGLRKVGCSLGAAQAWVSEPLLFFA